MSTHDLLNDPSVLIVKRLILVGIVASLAHFIDNAFEIGRYPEPASITPGIVLFAYIPNAVVATTALLRKNGDLVFVALCAIFGLLLLTGLAHYLYGSPFKMDGTSNFTIVFEALSGVALLTVLFRSIARPATRHS
jgi:hypothetical protein